MPLQWGVGIVALWVLVLVETGLIVLLLRAVGVLQQTVAAQAGSSPGQVHSSTSLPELGGLAIGDLAPNFKAQDIHGNVIELDDSIGSKRLLAFLSLSCLACTGTLEPLNRLQDSHPEVTVLVVGGPDLQANRTYALEHGAEVPFLTFLPGFSEKLFKVQTHPFVFFLSEDGVVEASGIVNGKEHLAYLMDAAYAEAARR